MKSLREFLNETKFEDSRKIRVEFYEGKTRVEVSEFDSVEDLLNEKIDDSGIRFKEIITKRQYARLVNGHMVRFNSSHVSGFGIKIAEFLD